jgi:hypothetical protein|tara:strand:- start:111 stop:296 length:186 start_codon:yes stop_codon:yes gene_type:complete
MTQNHVPLIAQQTAENSKEPLLVIVRLLARHAAADAIKRVRAEQSACLKILPTDTGATNDV